MTSPLRYPGGKTRACKVLETYFDTNAEVLISPFFGGGSFELYLQSKYNIKIIANDKFQPLYNFWQEAKTNKNQLVDHIKAIGPVNKEKFLELRNNVSEAKNYFAVNRCSFSGSTTSGGFSVEASTKRFTDSSIERITDLDLTNIEFHNEDFSTFIPKHLNGDKPTCMFLDPPYVVKSKLYGNNGDLHEKFDHQLLFETIKDRKNWFMTYNDCEFIRSLYKDFTIISVDWKYGMNTSKESSEIVICSN